MPRPYRLQAEGVLYHITSRGDDRKKIFLNETDCRKFLEYLKAVKEKFKFFLYAYCLMGNHYHLLLETTQPNISRLMQSLNTAYTVYYNTKRKHCGHLFQGRYKSIVVDKDSYFLELTRYIHLNPVRAKIVDGPGKFKWSSYNDYINMNTAGLVDTAEAFRYFDLSAEQYKEFVLSGINNKGISFKDVYAGFILGKEKFVKDTLSAMKAKMENSEFSYKKSACGIEPDSILHKVASCWRVSPVILLKSKRKPLLARKIAVYLLKRISGLTNEQIGAKFEITYSAVSKIAQDVERRRIKDKKMAKDIDNIISHFKV